MGRVGILRGRITWRHFKALNHPGIPILEGVLRVIFPPFWQFVLSEPSSPLLCAQNPAADAFLLPGLVWFALWCAFVPQAGLLIKVKEDTFYPPRLGFILSFLRHWKAFVTVSWWTLSPSNEGTGQGVSRAENPWPLVGPEPGREWLILL